MAKVKIIFKTGAEVLITCDNFSIRINDNNQLISYDIEGIQGDCPLFIKIEEIVAILKISEDKESKTEFIKYKKGEKNEEKI